MGWDITDCRWSERQQIIILLNGSPKFPIRFEGKYGTTFNQILDVERSTHNDRMFFLKGQTLGVQEIRVVDADGGMVSRGIDFGSSTPEFSVVSARRNNNILRQEPDEGDDDPRSDKSNITITLNNFGNKVYRISADDNGCWKTLKVVGYDHQDPNVFKIFNLTTPKLKISDAFNRFVVCEIEDFSPDEFDKIEAATEITAIVERINKHQLKLTLKSLPIDKKLNTDRIELYYDYTNRGYDEGIRPKINVLKQTPLKGNIVDEIEYMLFDFDDSYSLCMSYNLDEFKIWKWFMYDGENFVRNSGWTIKDPPAADGSDIPPTEKRIYTSKTNDGVIEVLLQNITWDDIEIDTKLNLKQIYYSSEDGSMAIYRPGQINKISNVFFTIPYIENGNIIAIYALLDGSPFIGRVDGSIGDITSDFKLTSITRPSFERAIITYNKFLPSVDLNLMDISYNSIPDNDAIWFKYNTTSVGDYCNKTNTYCEFDVKEGYKYVRIELGSFIYYINDRKIPDFIWKSSNFPATLGNMTSYYLNFNKSTHTFEEQKIENGTITFSYEGSLDGVKFYIGSFSDPAIAENWIDLKIVGIYANSNSVTLSGVKLPAKYILAKYENEYQVVQLPIEIFGGNAGGSVGKGGGISTTLGTMTAGIIGKSPGNYELPEPTRADNDNTEEFWSDPEIGTLIDVSLKTLEVAIDDTINKLKSQGNPIKDWLDLGLEAELKVGLGHNYTFFRDKKVCNENYFELVNKKISFVRKFSNRSYEIYKISRPIINAASGETPPKVLYDDIKIEILNNMNLKNRSQEIYNRLKTIFDELTGQYIVEITPNIDMGD